MELPVLFQAEQFAQALLLGGLLGLVYDLLRAPRKFLPKLAGILDALFLLALLLSLLFFALYAGQGQFRLFFFPGILLGAAGYFLALSPVVLRALTGLLRGLGKILHGILQPVRFCAKKFSDFFKNLFARSKKWGTIIDKIFLRRADSDRGKAQHEIRQVFPSGEARHPDSRVYATVTLVSLRQQINEKSEQEAILNSSIASTRQENNRLQDSIDALGTDEGVAAVARDKLGMVEEGDIIFYDVGE